MAPYENPGGAVALLSAEAISRRLVLPFAQGALSRRTWEIRMAEPKNERTVRNLQSLLDIAHLTLVGKMHARGLFVADDWSVVESTREIGGGTELVLHPSHPSIAGPRDMECVVKVYDDAKMQHICRCT